MKNASTGLSVMPAGIEARLWNGHAIQRRQVDGFVNATAMCRASGKRWGNYFANERTREYICALAASLGAQIPCRAAVTGNPVTGIHGLIHVIRGGNPELQGTWIHPRLAVDLARWISPAFAVWMDGWFLEALGVAPSPAQPAPLPPAPRRPNEDPLQPLASYLRFLVAQRWMGDPEANGLIRGIAQHLLLSCDPLPAVDPLKEETSEWYVALCRRTGC